MEAGSKVSWKLSSCLAFLLLIKSKPVGLVLLTGLLCFCMKPLLQPVVLRLTCSLQTAVCLLVNFKQTKNKTQSVVQFQLDVWWSLLSPPIAYRKYANSSGGRWAHLAQALLLKVWLPCKAVKKLSGFPTNICVW